MSHWHIKCIKECHTYFVNGYKFHTNAWSKGKKTINSGVHVKGFTEGGEDDFYWIIHRIYELQYYFFVNGLIPPEKVQECILNITFWTFTWLQGTNHLIHLFRHTMLKKYIMYNICTISTISKRQPWLVCCN